MSLPNPPQTLKEPIQKPQLLEYKKIHELIDSNRQIIKKLPEMLYKHLEYYEKVHLDESAQISRNIEDGNFLEQLNNFKQVSFEFVEHLTQMKKNFTTLLTREQEPSNGFDPKRVTNFQVFVADHCENVVKHHLTQISTIDVQENVAKIQKQS